jgi:hypothetical protein
MIRLVRSQAAALVLVSVALLGACSSATQQVDGAALSYDERRPTAHVAHSVAAVADATEAVFRTMGITFEERDGDPEDMNEIEVEGEQGDAEINVEIERHGEPVKTRIEVAVRRDTDFDYARAQQILAAILARLE